jgi:hypothetical protein
MRAPGASYPMQQQPQLYYATGTATAHPPYPSAPVVLAVDPCQAILNALAHPNPLIQVVSLGCCVLCHQTIGTAVAGSATRDCF